jgi:hypothetical protein
LSDEQFLLAALPRQLQPHNRQHTFPKATCIAMEDGNPSHLLMIASIMEKMNQALLKAFDYCL